MKPALETSIWLSNLMKHDPWIIWNDQVPGCVCVCVRVCVFWFSVSGGAQVLLTMATDEGEEAFDPSCMAEARECTRAVRSQSLICSFLASCLRVCVCVCPGLSLRFSRFCSAGGQEPLVSLAPTKTLIIGCVNVPAGTPWAPLCAAWVPIRTSIFSPVSLAHRLSDAFDAITNGQQTRKNEMSNMTSQVCQPLSTYTCPINPTKRMVKHGKMPRWPPLQDGPMTSKSRAPGWTTVALQTGDIIPAWTPLLENSRNRWVPKWGHHMAIKFHRCSWKWSSTKSVSFSFNP